MAPPKSARNLSVGTKLTEEYARLEGAAATCGLTVGEWCREDILLQRFLRRIVVVLFVMNSAGVVIENNRTLPYGEAWLAESTPSTNDKKFTTYQRDQESGLDYAMERYYANANGEPADVAGAIVFLASDAAAWITGETMVIDGGLRLGNPVPYRHGVHAGD